MLSINDLKIGTKIKIHDEPFEILETHHFKLGRNGAILKVKIKNLSSGNVFEKNYKSSDKFEKANLNETRARYLYRQKNQFYFMNEKTYEEFTLDKNNLGDAINYLIEEVSIKILTFEEKPIKILLPPEISLKVIDAPPGIKGDTAESGTKIVTLETGLKIITPLHIKENDIIKIKTESGKYAGKA